MVTATKETKPAVPALAIPKEELIAKWTEVTPEVRAIMWKNERECTPAEKAIRSWQLVCCSVNVLHFMKYCQIDIASTKLKTGGAKLMEPWPHLINFLYHLLKDDLIDLYKSRQVGASWCVAGPYILWRCLFQKSTKVIYMSKGENEGIELLRKTKFVYLHLPPFLQSLANTDNSLAMEFKVTGSRIDVFPSTESAGVSFTGSIIVWDEWEQHPYAEQNFLHAKPVIDGGGQIIGIWVRDPKKAVSQARSVWLAGIKPSETPEWNGWHSLFYGWDVVPGRDQSWYDQTKRTTTLNELAGLDRDTYMACNYPKTWQEGLRAIGTMAAFQPDVIDAMAGDVRNRITVVHEGLDTAVANIFKPHMIGNYYAAGSDVSHGTGNDYHVTVPLNVRTGEVPADIFANNISETYFASQSVILLKLFGSPMWWIENNDWGRAVINVALALKYPNLGYEDEKKTKIGFHTGEHSRADVWFGLVPAVNNRQIIIYNVVGLRQFQNVIKNADKNGRFEAKSGGNDDYPMAVGIAWFNRKYVSVDMTPYRVHKSLAFAGV